MVWSNGKSPTIGCALALVALASCGDDGSAVFDSNGATESVGATTSPAATTAPGSSSAAPASATETPTSTEGTSTGMADASTTVDTSTPNLDVGTPKGGLGPCGCELAYIWIANASDGTVSKINVRTLEEEGRYITRPDRQGNPSRTSVNLAGDVAVANRHGGLVKIFADPDDCQDTNGMPGIQTSSGPGDVLSWDVEECRNWYTEFPTTNQRPVAWIAGAVTPGTCDSAGEMVWTVHSETPGFAPGTGGAGGVIAALVDGATGEVSEEVLVEKFSGLQLGAYGGAVDAAGSLFFIPMGALALGGQLARVEIDTMAITLWDLPAGVAAYGITVDHNGMVWVSSTFGAGAARFDPNAETWDVVSGFMSAGGLAEGPDNHMWIATSTGAISIDIDNLMPGNVFASNQTSGIKGISADVDGYIWAVGDRAWKVDPTTGAHIDRYDGLTSPYTYSDMTGYALGNVACPPEG